MLHTLPLAAFSRQAWAPAFAGSSPALWLSLAPLFALLACAAVIDWRTRKIPNWLTFGLFSGGLLRAILAPLLFPGEFGIVEAILGSAMGFALGVPLFAIGARGAGDAKLYIACGAWLGWQGVLVIFVLEAVVGLVMVIVQCALRGKLRELFRNTGVLIISVLFVRRIGVEQAQANARQFTSVDRKLPHAVPFLAAAVLSIALALI